MDKLTSLVMNLPALGITWVTFLGAGIISYVLQLRMMNGGSFVGIVRYCIPPDLWRTKSGRADVALYLTKTGVTAAMQASTAAVTLVCVHLVSESLRQTWPGFVAQRPSALALVGCIATLFLVAEFFDYFSHYLSHRIQFFWQFHKVHHSATFLNPLTTKRGHPLDQVMWGYTGSALMAVPVGMFGFYYQLTLAEMFFLRGCVSRVAIIITLDALKHSHIPVRFGWLEYVLISPHMHHIHHSSLEHHWDRNYGTNLSLFDWLFRTAYKPVKDEPIVYGIYGLDAAALEKCSTVYGALVSPVLSAWSILVDAWRPAQGERSRNLASTVETHAGDESAESATVLTQQ